MNKSAAKKELSKKQKPQQRPPVTWAQAARDILTTAMAKGQLIPLVIGAVLAITAYRMPEDKLYVFAEDLLHALVQGNLWGYVLSVVVMISWHSHVKSLRKKASEEFARIGKEKSELQNMMSPVRLETSDN